MKIVTLKNSLLAGLVLIIMILLLFQTCERSPKTDANPAVFQDTVFLSQWRKERKEKQALVVSYEKKIAALQQENKTLRQATQQSKQHLYSYRSKSDSLKTQLNKAIHHFTQKDSSIHDTIVPLINELSSMRDSSDLQCDTTITLLEKEVLNRDSMILFQQQIERQLRSFNQEQTLQNDYLTGQLNAAYKQQKKKIRQNKLLTGGLLILSGIATSLLLIQANK